MPVTHDVFSLLRIFARNNKSPHIGYDAFRSFVERYAKKYGTEHPELAKFLNNPELEVDARVRELSVGGKLSIACDRNDRITSIDFPYFYVDIVAVEYIKIESAPEIPFPDEASLNLRDTIPSELIRSLSIETDINSMIDEVAAIHEPIVRLAMPADGGSFLILPRLLPGKLFEYSLQKIRTYIRDHNNKEYIQSKLLPAFPGKEMMLKSAVNLILTQPTNSGAELKKSDDFYFPFFAHLTGLIKSDIQKKNDRLEEDTGIYRAAFIVEAFNNFYKSRTQREQRVESALRNLDQLLKKQPFFFSMDDILGFKDSGGVLLLGQYSKEALEARLKELMDSSERTKLPALLAFHLSNGSRYYVLKENIFPLFLRLCGEAREAVRRRISAEWFKLRSEYRTVDAMENDEAFAVDLGKRVDELFPVLGALLDYRILALVYDELARDNKNLQSFERIFYKGNLAPLPDILSLNRKNLLIDVKVMLPFWHSIPILNSIMAFFGRRRGKAETKAAQKRPTTIEVPTEGEPDDAVYRKNADERKRYIEAMENLEKNLIPDGYDIDGYLEELNDRWNTLINPDAKKNLKDDVDSMIRDYLRKYIRTLKVRAPNEERLDEMADTLVQSTSFTKIRNKEYLREYVKLYLYRLIVKSASFGTGSSGS
jgi:hypothetical protein